MPVPAGLILRPLEPGDSIPVLTALLHRAYKELADMGLRYLATHQDDETTARRAAGGECAIVELAGEIVGTVTFLDPARTGGSPWYDLPDAASFTQFCVDPSKQRLGIGSMMLDHVERRAQEEGAAEVACDTAEGASHLIRMYEARGYRIVETVDWRPTTNYLSVVLSKPLAP